MYRIVACEYILGLGKIAAHLGSNLLFLKKTRRINIPKWDYKFLMPAPAELCQRGIFFSSSFFTIIRQSKFSLHFM